MNKHIKLLEQLTGKKVTLKEQHVKRYVVLFDMYVYASDDQQAKEEANKIMLELNDKYDAQASVKEIHEMSFGSTTPRKVSFESVQDDALVPAGEQRRFDMIKQACKELGVGDVPTLVWVDAKVKEIQANKEGKLLSYGALKKIISALFSGQQN